MQWPASGPTRFTEPRGPFVAPRGGLDPDPRSPQLWSKSSRGKTPNRSYRESGRRAPPPPHVGPEQAAARRARLAHAAAAADDGAAGRRGREAQQGRVFAADPGAEHAGQALLLVRGGVRHGEHHRPLRERQGGHP